MSKIDNKAPIRSFQSEIEAEEAKPKESKPAQNGAPFVRVDSMESGGKDRPIDQWLAPGDKDAGNLQEIDARLAERTAGPDVSRDPARLAERLRQSNPLDRPGHSGLTPGSEALPGSNRARRISANQNGQTELQDALGRSLPNAGGQAPSGGRPANPGRGAQNFLRGQATATAGNKNLNRMSGRPNVSTDPYAVYLRTQAAEHGKQAKEARARAHQHWDRSIDHQLVAKDIRKHEPNNDVAAVEANMAREEREMGDAAVKVEKHHLEQQRMLEEIAKKYETPEETARAEAKKQKEAEEAKKKEAAEAERKKKEEEAKKKKESAESRPMPDGGKPSEEAQQRVEVFLSGIHRPRKIGPGEGAVDPTPGGKTPSTKPGSPPKDISSKHKTSTPIDPPKDTGGSARPGAVAPQTMGGKIDDFAGADGTGGPLPDQD